jgi:hypothetical protein
MKYIKDYVVTSSGNNMKCAWLVLCSDLHFSRHMDENKVVNFCLKFELTFKVNFELNG